MKSHLLACLLLISLSGCASTTDIAKLDRDTYVVSSSSSSVFISNQDLLTTSAAKARKFCANQNQEMEQVTDRFIEPDRGFGRRQFMFQFRCVDV